MLSDPFFYTDDTVSISHGVSCTILLRNWRDKDNFCAEE